MEPQNRKLQKTKLAEIASLDTGDATKMNKKINWSIHPTVLMLPYESAHYTLEKNKYNFPLRGVLQLKEPDELIKQIWYYPRYLTKIKFEIDKIKREGLATVWFVLILRPWSKGDRFAIQPVHDYLKWILPVINTTSRFPDWRQRLSENEFDVAHWSKGKYQANDEFSRTQSMGADTIPIKAEIVILVIKVF